MTSLSIRCRSQATTPMDINTLNPNATDYEAKRQGHARKATNDEEGKKRGGNLDTTGPPFPPDIGV